MVLVRQKLQRNFQLPLPQLQICELSPFSYYPKPSISNITIQGVSPAVGDLYDLEKLCVLGHGNHGIVYKVIHGPTSAIYALKIVQDKDHVINTNNPCLSREIEILTSTDSPFIIKCHGVFEPSAGEKAILMEYMDGGTLDTLIKANYTFPETLLSYIAKHILNGLSYLQYACNIVHLDIKPSNILVSKDMKNVKIGDFGVSKIVHGDAATSNCDNLGSQGTYAYMSPERLDSQTFGIGYVYAGDVWSLGITLWELYVGHFPFFSSAANNNNNNDKKKPNWMELVMEICYGDIFGNLPKQASQEFGNFLKCCLEREPSKRWTVSQLLSHPFVCMERETSW